MGFLLRNHPAMRTRRASLFLPVAIFMLCVHQMHTTEESRSGLSGSLSSNAASVTGAYVDAALPQPEKLVTDPTTMQKLKKTEVQREFLEWYAAGYDAPWDIHGPQPYVVEAEEKHLFQGKILDVGCGPGDNAIYLGEKGYKVTAVEFSAHAIEEAKKRVSTAGGEALGNVKFIVGNALDLDPALKGQQFDTVLDSALLHCFDNEQQEHYIASLATYLTRGGQLLLGVMSDHNPPERRNGPNRMALKDFDRLFYVKNVWRVISIQLTKYAVAEKYLDHGQAYAWFVVITRL